MHFTNINVIQKPYLKSLHHAVVWEQFKGLVKSLCHTSSFTLSSRVKEESLMLLFCTASINFGTRDLFTPAVPRTCTACPAAVIGRDGVTSCCHPSHLESIRALGGTVTERTHTTAGMSPKTLPHGTSLGTSTVRLICQTVMGCFLFRLGSRLKLGRTVWPVLV